LAEEYTGFLCGNCPEAGIYLADTLQRLFGEQMVAMAVHTGFFSIPCPGGACTGSQPAGAFQNDYSNATSNDWGNFFGIALYPGAMINRFSFPNNFQFPKASWSTKIAAEIAKPVEAKIRLKKTLDQANREVSLCIQNRVLVQQPNPLKLQVVLVEDSVMDWQLWYFHTPEYVPDYFHRHMLRESINGSFGVDAFEANAAVGSIQTTGYKFTVNSSYDLNQTAAVVFLYDANTYRVLQVEEIKLK
jgi:hypothetical protein